MSWLFLFILTIFIIGLLIIWIVNEPGRACSNTGLFHLGMMGLSWNPLKTEVKSKTSFGTLSGQANESSLLRHLYLGNNVYEPNVVDKMSRYLKQGDHFIDVGAGEGFFSMMASVLVGPQGKVYSFEVRPSKVSLFNKFHSQTGLARNIRLLQVAPISILPNEEKEEEIKRPEEPNPEQPIASNIASETVQYREPSGLDDIPMVGRYCAYRLPSLLEGRSYPVSGLRLENTFVPLDPVRFPDRKTLIHIHYGFGGPELLSCLYNFNQFFFGHPERKLRTEFVIRMVPCMSIETLDWLEKTHGFKSQQVDVLLRDSSPTHWTSPVDRNCKKTVYAWFYH